VPWRELCTARSQARVEHRSGRESRTAWAYGLSPTAWGCRRWGSILPPRMTTEIATTSCSRRMSFGELRLER
jgi:hypothetical protein